MSKLQPNLEILHDKVLEFNLNQPDEYFESIVAYLSENPSQIHNIFDNLVAVFASQHSLLNALQVVFLIVWRIGAPAFFGLESSRIPELQPDINMQHDELLELKRITKYCTDKFQKMQTLHEVPNIRQKYSELCQITNEELPLLEVQLTEFEKQYSELAMRFKQFEQCFEAMVTDSQNYKDNKPVLENTKGIQLLEQIDSLIIQPDQRFTKSENELILNFFHQKYAMINKVSNEFPQIAQEYQRIRQEKKAKLRQEKNEEEPKPAQELQTQNLKDFTSFIDGAALTAFPESMTVEYEDFLFPFRNEEVRKKLRATICAFLNTNGGRIFIGIGNTGFRVKGLFLTTNDQDTLIRDIDTLLKDFHPKVDPEEVTTTFIPIKKKDNSYKPGFYIVKIVVKRGKPNELYFSARDCFKRRNGQNDIQMPANFKRDIIEKAAITIQTHPDLFKDKGEYNDPAPELGLPVTNVKEKQARDVKPIKATGPKQKQNTQQQQQALAASTKLSVKNIPAIPDVELGLKALLSSVGPMPSMSKSMNFTKDNECILTFTKSEDAKSFLEYAENNPILVGTNILQFSMKPAEKEKPEKTKVKVEIEEEKKDAPNKGRTDNTSIIWVRGITENTGDLKEKIVQMLGPYAGSLRDIKIHNKKKRATLEFESSAQANQVLAYLIMEDRYLGEIKVSFEKASPPSSPSQASKPAELGKLNAKNEAAKVKQSMKIEPPKEVPKVINEPVVIHPTDSNAIKISNISMEPNGQLNYLINACGHYISKAVERQIAQDHAIFFFRDKEEAKKAYTFLTENNFTFQGRKLTVEYFIPVQQIEHRFPTMTHPNQGLARSEPVHTENLYPTFDMPDLLASLPVLPQGHHQQQQQQFNQFNAPNVFEAQHANLLQSEHPQQDITSLDSLIQQHQLFQQTLFENPPDHQNHEPEQLPHIDVNQKVHQSQQIQSATVPTNPQKDQIDLDLETLQLDIQNLSRSLSTPHAGVQSDDVINPQVSSPDSQQKIRSGSLNANQPNTDGLTFSFNPISNKDGNEQQHRERMLTPAFPEHPGPLILQQENETHQAQINQINPFNQMAARQQSSPSALEKSAGFNTQAAQSMGWSAFDDGHHHEAPTQTNDQNLQNHDENVPQNLNIGGPSISATQSLPSVQSIQNMPQSFRPMSEGAHPIHQFDQNPQNLNQAGPTTNVQDQGPKSVFGRPGNVLPPINQPQGPQNPNLGNTIPQPQETKSVFGRPPQNVTSMNPPSINIPESTTHQTIQPADHLNQLSSNANAQQQQLQGQYPQYHQQFPQSPQQTGFPQIPQMGNLNPNMPQVSQPSIPNTQTNVPNTMMGAQQQNVPKTGVQPVVGQPSANMSIPPQQNPNQQFVMNPNYFNQSMQKPNLPTGPQTNPTQMLHGPTNMGGQQQQIPQQNIGQQQSNVNQNIGQQGTSPASQIPQNQQNQNIPSYPPTGNPNIPTQGFPHSPNSMNQQNIQQGLAQNLQNQQYPHTANPNFNLSMNSPSNINPNMNPNINPNLNPNINPNLNAPWSQNQNMGNNMGSMPHDPKGHMPQQSYPYPQNQQFNQNPGQFGNNPPYPQQNMQNMNPQQGQYFNQQGQQYPMQQGQGQFPMQQQPYPNQPGQYPPQQFQGQQGQYPPYGGYPNQMGGPPPQGSTLQPTKPTGKPDPKDAKKQQSGKNQSQGKGQPQQGKNQQQLPPQMPGQMPGQLQSSQQVQPGMMGNYPNYGMNPYYQGYPPNNQMPPGPGPSGYGQGQMGYGGNPNMQNQQQNPMYQNMQGNMQPGNMQGPMQQGPPNYQNVPNFNNSQALNPQQYPMQQQMPQMQYGGQPYPPNMGMNPNVRSK